MLPPFSMYVNQNLETSPINSQERNGQHLRLFFVSARLISYWEASEEGKDIVNQIKELFNTEDGLAFQI
jgi:hypothetical protein